jgi:hypothetical protein
MQDPSAAAAASRRSSRKLARASQKHAQEWAKVLSAIGQDRPPLPSDASMSGKHAADHAHLLAGVIWKNVAKKGAGSKPAGKKEGGDAAPVNASTPTQLSCAERYKIRSAKRDEAQASGEHAAKAACIFAATKFGLQTAVGKQLSFELSSSSSMSPLNTAIAKVPQELVVQSEESLDVGWSVHNCGLPEGVGMDRAPFFCAASMTFCRCPGELGVDLLMCVNCGLLPTRCAPRCCHSPFRQILIHWHFRLLSPLLTWTAVDCIGKAGYRARRG